MRNFFSCGPRSMAARLALVSILPFFLPVRLPAQVTSTDQEVQVLRQEVVELKNRLAELETKLAAFPAPASAANAHPAATHLVEPPPSAAPVVAASAPPPSTADQSN